MRTGHRGRRRGRVGWRLFSQGCWTEGSPPPALVTSERLSSWCGREVGRGVHSLCRGGRRRALLAPAVSQVSAPHNNPQTKWHILGWHIPRPPSPEPPKLASSAAGERPQGGQAQCPAAAAGSARGSLPCVSEDAVTAGPARVGAAPRLTAARRRLLGHPRVLAGPWGHSPGTALHTG